MSKFVKERFKLNHYDREAILDMEPDWCYNGFSEFIFYRTYSRFIDGKQETWNDCVLRVIDGVMSIRKDYHIKNHINWNERYWQKIAKNMAISMQKMEWLPPGRGLWAMGTKFIYERGSGALQNCAFIFIGDNLFEDLSILMDCLMLGIGVGFEPVRNDNIKFKKPNSKYEYIIPDSREGWAESVRLLGNAYLYGASKPIFNYSEIRSEGEPIKGFGGIASGPEPLKRLHNQIEEDVIAYETHGDSLRLKMDLANKIGCCVIVGNVRRSAELAQGRLDDYSFRFLKDYDKYPERRFHGYMSNNPVKLETDEDFERIGEIIEQVIKNGEPGILNMRNFPKGRIGKNDNIRKDKAKGVQPCSEMCLEDRELCTLAETVPTRCQTTNDWYRACKWATLYATTVTLLPTHQPTINVVMLKNRRIGVGIVDFAGWIHEEGVARVTKYLRKGYKVVRKWAKKFNEEVGIPEPIKVTTMKPGGTVPLVAGRESGMRFPNFHYMIRRVKVASNSPINKLLIEAGVPWEPDYYSNNTNVYEFPLYKGPTPCIDEKTVWEQAAYLMLLQREWSDNAVSNTLMFKPKWTLLEIIKGEDIIDELFGKLRYYLGHRHQHDEFITKLVEHNLNYEDSYFKVKALYDENDNLYEINLYNYNPKHEENDLEPMMAATVPLIKGMALLPHTPKGVYHQMPEEGITKEEYEKRTKIISKIDWNTLNESDGIDERYCSSDSCELIK